jgi:chemotaxis response regulator CheB
MDQEDIAYSPPSEKAPECKAFRHTGTIPFSIIGIGSSAGGLEALERLLRAKTVDGYMSAPFPFYTTATRTTIRFI